MGQTLLSVDGLAVYFYQDGEKVLCVDSIDLQIYAGKTHCLVGESGSGKSVTALSIMGLIPPEVGGIAHGSIKLNGQELVGVSDKQLHHIRGKELGMVFQEPMTSLNPVLTIGEQLTEGYLYHYGASRAEAESKAKEMLQTIGLSNVDKLMRQYPHSLSGGMRQRIMIAIALLCGPKVLIADEPTTALDVTIQAQILKLMKDMQEKMKMSMLFITHDLGVVRAIADYVHVCYAGQLVEEAPMEELFRRPMHPYTRALLAAIPSIEDDDEPLTSVPGTVPSPQDFPQGCRFSNRCGFACAECCAAMPSLREVFPTHFCRCPHAERLWAQMESKVNC